MTNEVKAEAQVTLFFSNTKYYHDPVTFHFQHEREALAFISEAQNILGVEAIDLKIDLLKKQEEATKRAQARTRPVGSID